MSEPARLGDFELLREIGRGGMGVVWEARQLSLNRRVALKILPPGLREDLRLRSRFQREAEAAARLRHPGIVAVHAVGEAEGTPFIAMELVEGRSLAEVLAARRDGDLAGLPAAGPAWRRWAVEMVARVADALAAAHGAGILHRDVKPGNVLLEADGTPRLTDFGLALDQHAAAMTLPGEIFGSPRYMSPEQVAPSGDRPIDVRSDVYSLTVTLYESLTLRSPYRADTPSAILHAVERGEVVAPRTADPGLPPALERVLLHGLARDPARRCPGAATFAAELRTAVADPSEVRAGPAPGGWRGRRWILVTCCALVIVVAAAAWNYQQSLRVPQHVRSSTPTEAQLGALASGRDADGAALLARWIRPELAMRGVISRSEPGAAEFRLEFERPHEVPPGVQLVWWPEVEVDGESSGPLHAPSRIDLRSGEGSVTFVSPIGTDVLLAGWLERDVLHVVPRAVISLRRTADGPDSPAATWTWEGEPRSLLVYDRYPDDYPRVIGGSDVDARMQTLCRPARASFVRVGGITGARHVLLELEFRPAPEGPVAVSFLAELHLDDAVVGTAGLAWAAARGAVTSDAFTTTVAFRLAEPPSDAEQRLVLELSQGRLARLHLVLRASRDVALQQPDCDTYWGGTVDADVPVGPVSSPR